MPFRPIHTFARLLLMSAVLSLPVVSLPAHAAINKSQAAAKAKAAHGGKVLSVEKVGSKDGKNIYKVKLLLDGGRVKTVTVSG